MRLAALVLAIASCHGSCGLDLERMTEQPRYSAYEACDVCPGGTIMMQPPAGTVHRAAELASGDVARGHLPDGRHVADIPIPVDAQLLARGKDRFDIYCAACHGRLGDGLTQVAENMTLRRPPNLLAPKYVQRAAGHHFAVVSHGFGLMRSYAAELPIRDRWAVVAYLQVLQLAQHVALRDLPEPRREEARRWLR